MIKEYLAEHPEAIQEALDNGSKDNVTCEVIHVVDA